MSKLINMTYYILFCLVFGATFYVNYVGIKVYKGINFTDIVLMIMMGILSPMFIVMALAVWCVSKLKTI